MCNLIYYRLEYMCTIIIIVIIIIIIIYIWSNYGVQKIVRHCKTSSVRIQAAAVAEVVPTSSSSELWCPALILEVRQDRAVSLITCNFWLAKLGVVKSWQPWSWRNQQRIKESKDQRQVLVSARKPVVKQMHTVNCHMPTACLWGYWGNFRACLGLTHGKRR